MSKDIIGTRIGLYDVLYECDYKTKDGHRLYHVKCYQCGFETNIRKSHMTRGNICNHQMLSGNYIDYNIRWKNKRLHKIYRDINQRCYKINDKSYRWYGAKGIKICEDWLNNPLSFESWALSNGYKDDLTIDRIDGTKDYCPKNCRWVSKSDNSKYKSTTQIIKVEDETHTGREWAKILGLGKNLINKYIRMYGLDETSEFIKRYRNNPNIQKKPNENIYSLYMKD